MPADPNIRLFELVLANGRSASQFVWRIRYALAHGDTMLAESWDIAEHLDRAYFRQSHEARLEGTMLEAFTAERESRLPALREAFTPPRWQLERGFDLYGGLGRDARMQSLFE
jgi:hypothetical protein